MNIIDNVVTALEKRLKEKTEERNKVFDKIESLKKLEEKLDKEKAMLDTSIDYLKNHCRNTLEVGGKD